MKDFKQPAGEFGIYDPATPRTKPDTSSPLKRAIVELEDRIRKQDFETGAFFDDEGVVVLQRSGQPDKVSFTHGELLSMHAHTFSHNHPRGASFSLGDVVMAAEYGLKELRAVTDTFRHSMAGRWPSADELSTVYGEEYPKAENEAREMVRMGELHRLNFGFEVYHRVWARVAARLGLIYRREKS